MPFIRPMPAISPRRVQARHDDGRRRRSIEASPAGASDRLVVRPVSAVDQRRVDDHLGVGPWKRSVMVTYVAGQERPAGTTPRRGRRQWSAGQVPSE